MAADPAAAPFDVDGTPVDTAHLRTLARREALRAARGGPAAAARRAAYRLRAALWTALCALGPCPATSAPASPAAAGPTADGGEPGTV